ncbi:MAG TPA: hypothetical protein K8W02_08420 [Mediterranea massiliensis]|uniref:Lipocalin-like domain-containing protein n=1 Tax=Mediterranea massiliensis TaxID=1841865 RepID=A0A921HXJ7_9BACT|nr:hypothetical protein [Mediterranea massiliensis]MBM6734609.1 hypothetical protein [Mediterranea massiliensis]CCZ49323.1 uncharacterized protein BN750_01183 [Bacteroides sp. CAG:661]HJF92390.1 hypothetical protein [Mediterranea massiliensis]
MKRKLAILSVICTATIALNSCSEETENIYNEPALTRTASEATVTFSNRTVTTDETVSGTDIITENITVKNQAKLTFEIDNSVTINGPFTVEYGSELEIN